MNTERSCFLPVYGFCKRNLISGGKCCRCGVISKIFLMEHVTCNMEHATCNTNVPITDCHVLKSPCVLVDNFNLLAVPCRNLHLIYLFSRVLPMVLQSVIWFSLTAKKMCAVFARIFAMASVLISSTVTLKV